MDVAIKRIAAQVALPEYKTPGAVAADCVAREGAVIAPHALGYVPLNFALKPPAGHTVILVARSSLHKKGLMLANGVGIFDEDFSGDGDEYQAIFYNFTNAPVAVAQGDRLVQILAVPYTRMNFNEVETLGNATRGGIGSTGEK